MVFNGRRFEGGGKALDDCTWAEIAQAYRDGTAESMWPVGSTKKFVINGLVGTQQFTNFECEAFIIGYDHNAAREGYGITFQIGKLNGTDICLVGGNYGLSSSDGTKYFNMNHSINTNIGGWKRCDLRYDILGSTNVNGSNATTTCATSPVSGTLMAALPSDLRAVMKPMTVWTDNVGRGSGSVSSNVTSTVDYLPLLAEYEIFGTDRYSNSYEKNYQEQYDYYKNGNSKIKYRHDSTSSAAIWLERSPNANGSGTFCLVRVSGIANYGSAISSLGLSPKLLIA